VDSAVVKIVAKKNVAVETQNFVSVHEEEVDFFKLVKAGFSSKRKMLKNNLANIYNLEAKEVECKLDSLGFDIKIRAQDLSIDDWKKLLQKGNFR
jgi:16S rRNA (adenine1518-N6/adenine1519-N6)-dimethyltransferase